jgi:hypothetical protein
MLGTVTNLNGDVLGFWLDRTSDPDRPAWVISRDTYVEDECTSSRTIRAFPQADYVRARAAVMQMGRDQACRVIASPDHGPSSVIFDPRG